MNPVFVCISITALPNWKSPSVTVEKDVFFDSHQADDWILQQYRKFLRNGLVLKDTLKLLDKPSNTTLDSLSNEEVLRGLNEWIGSKYVHHYWRDSYMDILPFECTCTTYSLPTNP